VATSADEARVSLGVRLRDIRRDAGLSGTRLAELCGWLSSKVSKIEHGRQTPSEDDLRAWCEHCHALVDLRDLIAAVRSIETQFAEWRRIIRGGIRRRQQASAAVYERTRLFRIYEPAVVPGLLQTREYAVAVLSTSVNFFRVPDDAEESATARLDRQRVLTHGDRHFHMLLGEQALRTNVGGAEVMAAQLEHLLAVLRLPRLRLGVIPIDAPYRVPLNNGFWIMDESLVQFDTYSAELSLIRPDEISVYSRAFERLAALAVYGTEARLVISVALARLGPGKLPSKTEQTPLPLVAGSGSLKLRARAVTGCGGQGDASPRQSRPSDHAGIDHGDQEQEGSRQGRARPLAARLHDARGAGQRASVRDRGTP
jgi:transcriptional regulator with XRE-family HTH domain